MKKVNKKKKKAFRLKRRKSYSSIYEQVVRVSPMVVNILKKDKKSRDDDNVLLIAFWKRHGIKENTSFKRFKYKLIMGKIGLPESIMRARRLMQEKHPSLRGKLYLKRQKAEELMLNQLQLF